MSEMEYRELANHMFHRIAQLEQKLAGAQQTIEMLKDAAIARTLDKTPHFPEDLRSLRAEVERLKAELAGREGK